MEQIRFVEDDIMANKQIGIARLPAQFFIDHCKESDTDFARSVDIELSK